MALAPQTPPAPAAVKAAKAPPPDAAPLAKLTREQVELEQMVERYLQGQLLPRQKMELEAFCRDNPKYIDEIQLSTRMHAGLRLIESAGRPEPWNEEKIRFWQTHWFAGAITAAVLAALVGLWQLNTKAEFQTRRAIDAERRLLEMPLSPAATSRSVTVVPAGNPSLENTMVEIGGNSKAEFVTMNIDFSRSNYAHVDVEIERIDQGRVALLRGLRRNSNGIVSLSLNSSALGPGNYIARLSGLDWRAQAYPAGAVTFSILAPRR
jgi:hypothetical protein